MLLGGELSRERHLTSDGADDLWGVRERLDGLGYPLGHAVRREVRHREVTAQHKFLPVAGDDALRIIGVWHELQDPDHAQAERLRQVQQPVRLGRVAYRGNAGAEIKKLPDTGVDQERDRTVKESAVQLGHVSGGHRRE
jgi:hypothetical protein